MEIIKGILLDIRYQARTDLSGLTGPTSSVLLVLRSGNQLSQAQYIGSVDMYSCVLPKRVLHAVYPRPDNCSGCAGGANRVGNVYMSRTHLGSGKRPERIGVLVALRTIQ